MPSRSDIHFIQRADLHIILRDAEAGAARNLLDLDSPEAEEYRSRVISEWLDKMPDTNPKFLTERIIQRWLDSPDAERRLHDAISAALQVREAAMKLNAEHGYPIFEDDDYKATTEAVLAVLRQ